MNPIGAHMSIAGGLSRAFQRLEAVGGECLQLFVKPNVQWAAGDVSLEEVERFQKERARTRVNPVVAHASYLLNLASPEADLRRRSILTLALEIVRCARLGLPYLILHPGSHGSSGLGVGIRRIAAGLDQALKRAAVPEVELLLETTAGAGTQVGHRPEQLRDILGHSRDSSRLGICLDTSHVFAAGFDLSREAEGEQFWQDLERQVGLERLKVIHANDSRTPLGSHSDRHMHIGQGYLGKAAFARLLTDPRLAGRPFILETPKGTAGDQSWDAVNIRTLKALRR
ncbi:MAG: deoxyribonuclease IV [Deltaproteobacteria bacterium]|nr:deoxyribonuclease IV [Deltaproteobacteria bacterium]